MTHFHPELTSEQCQQLLNRYEPVDFSQLTDLDERKPRRFFLKATYLHASKSARQMRTWMPNKKGSGGAYKETPVCDRFLVFGVPGTSHILLCFTPSPQVSKKVLRFSSTVKPGQLMYLINPDVKSFLGDNLVVILNNPLLPVPNVNQFDPVLPPTDLDKPHYAHFNFVTKSLRLASVSPSDSVCSGSFCDGQSETKACACIVSDCRKHWALNFIIICDEFEAMAKDDISYTSTQTTALFVANNVQVLPLSDPHIDSINMEDNVSENDIFVLNE